MWRTKEEKLRKLEEEKKKGKVDRGILRLLDLINSLEDYVSSSSCAGRVMLIDLENVGQKKGSKKVKVWHSLPSFEELWAPIETWKGRWLWLKVEPFILHVLSRDLESALEFMRLVREAGVKRGGIQTRSKKGVLIEIEGTGRLEFPVKKGEKLLIDKEGLRVMMDEIEEVMRKNEEQIKRLEKVFELAKKS